MKKVPKSPRRDQSTDEDEDYNEEPQLCKYGENCYRKNPEHLARFLHPHLDRITPPHSPSKSPNKDVTPKKETPKKEPTPKKETPKKKESPKKDETTGNF
jgi:hypothetical protein